MTCRDGGIGCGWKGWIALISSMTDWVFDSFRPVRTRREGAWDTIVIAASAPRPLGLTPVMRTILPQI